MSWHRMLVVLALSGPLLLAPTACSNEDPSTCAALQDLADEIRGLRSVDLMNGGTDAIAQQLEAIAAAWQEVEVAAEARFGVELGAMRVGLADARATLETLGDADTTGAQVVAELSSDLATLTSAWDDLVRVAQDELGSCDL